MPGIGKSTAGAIMSLAYLKPQPILDGNVKRVIARLIKKDLSSLKETELWKLSKELVDEVLEFLTVHFIKKKLLIKNRIAPNIRIEADKNMLTSIFRNLILNIMLFFLHRLNKLTQFTRYSIYRMLNVYYLV